MKASRADNAGASKSVQLARVNINITEPAVARWIYRYRVGKSLWVEEVICSSKEVLI
jgi:hypothetical protein